MTVVVPIMASFNMSVSDIADNNDIVVLSALIGVDGWEWLIPLSILLISFVVWKLWTNPPYSASTADETTFWGSSK